MTLDSLVGDAAWLGRYALDRSGVPMPWPLVEAGLRATRPPEVLALRAMLAVPYFEKALYEMREEEVTATSIAELADAVEKRIQGGFSPRPLLSVPHILSDESSCYYHGCALCVSRRLRSAEPVRLPNSDGRRGGDNAGLVNNARAFSPALQTSSQKWRCTRTGRTS